ncbi:hypothetical protein E3P99_00959 [Wallemia hederae]|uniref:DUF6534 domain-containing protein n=1 Tax=Wallemia hederae TaxID=1540922 RepID=A0A4T0FSZ1_9BASI|nr:hypothetical protein E3P99_00959 [Wallemia hederae]
MVYQPIYDLPALNALGQNMGANLGCYRRSSGQRISVFSLTPLVIGCVLNLVLFAVLGMQCLDYFSDPEHQPHSLLTHKLVVASLLIMGAFQSGCFVEMIWTTFIDGFGDLSVWNYSKWTWWSEPIVATIISLVCQSFYLQRCYKVTKKFIVIIPAGVGMLAGVGFGISCTYFLSVYKLYTESDQPNSKISATGWLVSFTFTDMWISSFLIVHLLRQRRKNRGGMPSTLAMLNSIIGFTMKTATFTSLCALANLILYSGNIDAGFLWCIAQFSLGKVYSICVLYTLLARIDVRKILQVHNVQVSSSRGRSNGDISAIHMRTEVEREYELDDKAEAAARYNMSMTPAVHMDNSSFNSGATFTEDIEMRMPQESHLEDDQSTRALRYAHMQQ